MLSKILNCGWFLIATTLLKHMWDISTFSHIFQIIYAKIKWIKYVMSQSNIDISQTEQKLLTSWCTVLNILIKSSNIIKYYILKLNVFYVNTLFILSVPLPFQWESSSSICLEISYLVTLFHYMKVTRILKFHNFGLLHLALFPVNWITNSYHARKESSG